MKLSDYLAEFLKANGVDTVFGYQGSSISHTIDSLSRCSGITFIETRHEQAAAFPLCSFGVDHLFGEQVIWSHEEARLEIFSYFEQFYNRVRIHSSLGYLSLWEYECATIPTRDKKE